MNHKGTKTLETDRLVLRRFSSGDARTMYDNWASDPEVTRFLTWETHASVEASRQILGQWELDYARNDNYQWAIVPREIDEPIGSISVVRIDEQVSGFEIGYCIGRRWWRQGITSEALHAVIDYLFGEVGALRICADHDSRNPNSGRVMRHCGMTFEGTLRQACRSNSGIGDMCVYSILRSEWN